MTTGHEILKPYSIPDDMREQIAAAIDKKIAKMLLSNETENNDPRHPIFVAGFKAGHSAGRARGEAYKQELIAKAKEEQRESDATFVDHIFREGGGTYGDAIRNNKE